MTTVKSTAELQAALAAGTDPQTIQIAAPEQVDVAAVQAAAVAAERERIAGIQALAQVGFEAEISAAIQDGSTVEAAGLALFKAAADRGVTVASIKRDAKGTKTTTPPAAAGGQKISSSSIWAARKGAK